MKPLQSNFAANALEYGVAGLNIDDARVLAKSGLEVTSPFQCRYPYFAR